VIRPRFPIEPAANSSELSDDDDGDGANVRGTANSITDGAIGGIGSRAVRRTGASADNVVTGNVILGLITDAGTDNVTTPNP